MSTIETTDNAIPPAGTSSSCSPKDHLRPRQRSRSKRRRSGGVRRSPCNAVMIRLIAVRLSAAGGVECYL
jgi:hypothetical protein